VTTRTQHNIEDEYAMDVLSRKRDVLYKVYIRRCLDGMGA
jgi:hypothetical protein